MSDLLQTNTPNPRARLRHDVGARETHPAEFEASGLFPHATARRNYDT